MVRRLPGPFSAYECCFAPRFALRVGAFCVYRGLLLKVFEGPCALSRHQFSRRRADDGTSPTRRNCERRLARRVRGGYNTPSLLSYIGCAALGFALRIPRNTVLGVSPRGVTRLRIDPTEKCRFINQNAPSNTLDDGMLLEAIGFGVVVVEAQCAGCRPGVVFVPLCEGDQTRGRGFWGLVFHFRITFLFCPRYHSEGLQLR